MLNFYTTSLLFTAITSFLLAIFVFSKGRDKITLGLFSLDLAIWTSAQAMGEFATEKGLVFFWTRINVAAAVMLPVFYLHLTLVLLVLNLNKIKIIRFSYLMALGFILLLPTTYFIKDVAPAVGFKYYPQPGFVYPFFALYIVVNFSYAFGQLVISLRQASGDEYKKLLYVFAGSMIGFSGGMTMFLPLYKINFPVLIHLTLPFYVITTIYAIVRHRLLDLTVYVRKGLVYSAITILFTSLYLILIYLTSNLFKSWLPYVVIICLVLVFQPLKDLVQKWVDRWFFMGEYRYKKTIDDLSAENKVLLTNLARADKLASLGTLTAGMAHEIKNPLAALSAMTEVLPENMTDQKFVKDYLSMMPRQLERINKIVENLLKAGRVQTLSKKETDLNNLIKQVLNLEQQLCGNQRIKIAAQLKPIPRMFLDYEQMEQVLLNLFVNAIQAMPNGGCLRVTSCLVADQIVLTVADTGVGIPKEKLDKIFDPFFTLKEQGTGLGLFIVYRIIQAHGGTIEVTSYEGTKFTICLPIRPKPLV